MHEHPNVTLVRDLFASLKRADAARVRELLADDAIWHFPGRKGGLAGDHKGHAGIFQFLLAVPKLTGGTFALDIIDVVGGEENVIVLFRGHAQREGRTLDNPTCLRARIAGGKIAELWEFVWDLHHVEEFWS